MNYYERHIGDYLKDTAHLSLLEHGVYTRLMDVYYTREEPLPAADVARLIGARSREERDALQAVLREFFRPDVEPPTAWLQPRCEAEIARYGEKRRKAKASAEARWSHTERNANASADAMRTHCDGNAPSHQTPDPIQKPSELTLATAFPPENRPPLALVEPSKPRPPDCPHLAVLALWAEVLPAMPKHNPGLWKGSRAAHLRARWRETAVDKGWSTEADGLQYLRRLFGYVGQSQFLSGRARSSDGRPPFVAELSWLVKPENWAKTIEGKYHGEAA